MWSCHSDQEGDSKGEKKKKTTTGQKSRDLSNAMPNYFIKLSPEKT